MAVGVEIGMSVRLETQPGIPKEDHPGCHSPQERSKFNVWFLLNV